MDAQSLASALRVEAEALAVAAAAAPPDRDVPACPGMTVGDLLVHIGSIHRLVATWIARGARPAGAGFSPGDADPVDWYRAGVASLLAVLDPGRAAEPAATWCPWDRTLGFWLRRMAHETAVHRVDAQAAQGVAEPLEAGLAADGIDEVLHLWLGCHQPPGAHTSGRAVALRVPGREWTVALHEGIVDYCPGAEPAAVVSGSSSAVDLWLWGRVGEEHVSVEGDVAVVRALRAAVAAATG
ncbi:maleylpyruvate isomerase N-terminal domain-containing protein [Saccharothrix sp. S26]|uniref:maleylpyruvate isomerase family mycothiol-dependent enzyme n=1 Tax=Saccharothrix sp. S26 TaxID=2907215 RepID=UPI001F17FE9E|nr:maleylpyruvate isomerase family mycothiol-dependent enzyme [Saccharothrix sp. S26]MCE6993552.1 maleylpyruvate isomerase N-terminal domain-containing protein [Saccharothrix sp. S26]